ncbi:acyl-CoA dehydrogenase family protein [Metabacillus malikii]|uniref:Alkylation response protein AidB-like acyl-CoA dehydrogenase n=1 Tax=Metabacillus malikii TaxID=1504265 RepID=A0ABT9ZGD7_9BACI|nr:acyl-CoA dehydrogenase family protein [Metabacillus malikii]MDQ0231343.1 alkylation response protein AidB-like acyl-CoA dehydrogenase [Metabacillus malikii]
MNDLDNQFIKTSSQREILLETEELAKDFALRAEKYDKESKFPFENFDKLKTEGYLKLTIPCEYGGDGASLYDFLLVQEKIAQGDAATALSLGWHLGLLMHMRETRKWEPSVFENLCREIIAENKLINSAATEPNSGSPARGGKPETTAEQINDKWRITGRKIFTSLAPALDYFIVPATIAETEEIGDFLIPRTANGLSIEETWDTLGMRGTRSDDLVLNNVEVPIKALVERKQKKGKPVAQGWLLHIPACYSGIAIAARNEAIEFAKTYQPTSLPHPIMNVPEVRRKAAEMDLKLTTARTLMYHTAEKWDNNIENRSELAYDLAIVKSVVTNTAVEVVDLAMRIVGGQSLFKSNALQRHYRDVRAGLHNPPSDDITTKLLADRAFRFE